MALVLCNSEAGVAQFVQDPVHAVRDQLHLQVAELVQQGAEEHVGVVAAGGVRVLRRAVRGEAGGVAAFRIAGAVQRRGLLQQPAADLLRDVAEGVHRHHAQLSQAPLFRHRQPAHGAEAVHHQALSQAARGQRLQHLPLHAHLAVGDRLGADVGHHQLEPGARQVLLDLVGVGAGTRFQPLAAGGKGLEASASSDPDQIEEYLARTGFELVVPNIGTESVTNRQVGVQWQVLEALAARGLGQRLVVHGFSSVRRLAVAEQRRLGELGVVAMNAFSYIPQEIGRRLLQEAAALHGARDPERGYPTGFAADGAPQYPDAAGRDDANVFFGPLLDQLRDLQVELIADSVYRILDKLGYARLGVTKDQGHV